MKTRKSLYLLALAPFLALVLLYELVPLALTIANGFRSPVSGGFSLGNFQKIFSTPLYQTAIVNSVWISILSSLAGILVAFLAAQAIHGTHGRIRTFFMTILNMTSNFSGLPLAFAYMIILGNAGVLYAIAGKLGWEALAGFNLYSRGGLLLVYIYFQIPFSSLLLVPAFDIIRREWKEVNLLLGGGPVSFWMRVGIPVLMPSILSTLSVLFCNALAAYATAYALMMNNFSLLPITISGMYTGDMIQQKELGGALSLLLMGLMCCAILIDNFLTARLRKEARRA